MLVSLRFGRIYFRFYHALVLTIPLILWLVLYFVLYFVVVRRFVGYLLNDFLFPYSNSIIIHYKNPYASECETFHCKSLVVAMSFFSYVVFLFVIASFAYYYRLAELYYFLNTDLLNYWTFVKEAICLKVFKNK